MIHRISLVGMIILAACNFQCSPPRVSAHDRREFRSIYIQQFKLTYLRKLLISAFNNDPAIDSMIRKDKSGFTEPVLTEPDVRLIDSMVALECRQLQADSASRQGRVAEGAAGKHVLTFLLHRLASQGLDKLAKARYRALGRRGF